MFIMVFIYRQLNSYWYQFDVDPESQLMGPITEEWEPTFEIDAVQDVIPLPPYADFATKAAYQDRIGEPKTGFTKTHKIINITEMKLNISSCQDPYDPNFYGTHDYQKLDGTIKFVELIISKQE
ncbi:hypothetical protein SAMD00019534_111930 [Acytostelium subglobosum LB1]|uniref:hypothetical protein n=1 Tax=Acytostelium subglobosum LB1 TaxID=1410327 RepID=UPI000644CF3E|nr:hypothetical protein SAMD00019534_111930 [Acytostelium subglobosum LB1]GAM28017.1 hypothetical protein SAMD00019534_111930 [Acytostelium subglobosum LB1]|eukprot:XP_012748976.1 hypothetical protein SAMD00019534_111930 [Acytostelium subglobosum LB1]